MQELRVDNINDDIVIVAKNRSKRPMDKVKTQVESEECNNVEYDEACPFCKGNEDYTTKENFKIEDENGWTVKSVDNKFPIVDNLPGDIYGRHEVMVDTHRHNGCFYNMSEKEFKHLFLMYKDRYNNFINDEKVEYISIFKNFLRKSGASLMHPHSQIISLSVTPPDINKEIDVANRYYIENNKSLYENLIKEEIECKKRVIYDGKYILVIVPYASRYSGEVRVIFKENIKFEELEDRHIEELSKTFKKLFSKLYEVNGYNPFNLVVHTHPINMKNKEVYNVHMHIIPRKYNFGGFELSTGMYVTSTNPEDLASQLKF